MGVPVPLAALAGGAALVGVHVLTPWFDAIGGRPTRWLSAAGGGAVAYVFVEALPAFAAVSQQLRETPYPIAHLAEYVHLVALAGFVFYYWLEYFVSSRTGIGEADGDGVFVVHLGSYAVYNALVGYFLVYPGVLDHERPLFAVAMALHLVGTDYGILERHGDSFRRFGRWVLAAAIAVGLTVGVVGPFGHAVAAGIYAFLVGGVVLNVVKEELPEAGETRYPAFLAGALVYAGLVVLWEGLVGGFHFQSLPAI